MNRIKVCKEKTTNVFEIIGKGIIYLTYMFIGPFFFGLGIYTFIQGNDGFNLTLIGGAVILMTEFVLWIVSEDTNYMHYSPIRKILSKIFIWNEDC